MTILFVELVGSSALFGQAGDEAADAVRREGLARLRRSLAEHEGEEVRSTGEGLVATFGSAAAAVRCAMDMQAQAQDAGLSVGMDAGEPVVEAGDVYGTPVITAERLCQAAASGEILASETVASIAGPRVGEVFAPVEALRTQGERLRAAKVRWGEEAERGEAEPAAPPSPAREVTVVVADDQDLLRAGFSVILDAEPDLRVVGEAPDGRAAVDVVTRRRPDVALMDIRMPELDGLKAAERILSDPGLDTAVLMLTTFDLDEYVYEALRIGASGFLLKDTPADRLLDAVRVAASGDALLAPSITRRLIERFAGAARPAPDGTPPGLEELTARELEVLRLVATGLSNSEIAAQLVLAENTVKTHVAHVLRKLGLRDRVQAVVVGYETGLVAPGA